MQQNSTNNKLEAFQRLLTIVDELREQCPWDKEQTLESIRHLSIEEVFELSDAILSEDYSEMQKELGDIIMHVLFYARIASEENRFDIVDVLNGICEKLIRRHPHIYGDVQVDGSAQVVQNWEQIKQSESSGKIKKTVLSGVPKGLPSIIKAYRMQEKAAAVGFDWEKKEDVWNKIEEELGEFKEATENNNTVKSDAAMEEEFGDLLFSLINYARFLKINPDDALEKTNRKFISRFNYVEQAAKNSNRELKDMTLEEMDVFWEEAKNKTTT